MTRACPTSVLLIAAALVCPAALTRAELEEGWILLQDGESNYGWTADAASGWSSQTGSLVMDGSIGGGFVRTKSPYTDFLLRFEVKTYSTLSNARLIVRANREGNPSETGYEVQLGNGGDSQWPFGSIIGQAKASAQLPVGSWISMEVEVNGTSMTVRSGVRTIATAQGILGQAGLIELASNRGGRLDVRGLRLKPLNVQTLFNGTDLSGWKSTGTQPKQPGKGLGKMFSGKGKPKEVRWTVASGLIHGDEGPGQLESVAPYGDFFFQADVRLNSKKNENKRHYGLMLRGDPGMLGTGYEVDLQPGEMGGVAALGEARKPAGAVNQFATVTVIAFERHFQVWVDGTPQTDVNDVRPEGTNPKKDARVAPGPISFYCAEDNSSIDIKNVKVIQLPKALGHVPVKKQLPGQPPPAGQPPAPAQQQTQQQPAQQPAGGSTTPPGYDAQMKLMQEQLAQQKMEKLKDDEKKEKVSSLLQQALQSPNPKEQVVLYDQILKLDPNNQVAFGARKDSQAKIDAENAKNASETQKKAQQDAEVAQKQETFQSNLDKAQSAFLSGNLAGADQALSAAEKVSPTDPRVQALRKALDGARGRTSSILGIAAIGGGAILLAALVWVFTVGRKKDPYLEIVDGLDKGKRFDIDQEVIRLGAIPEDGGVKNEVVLRDAERMVSRFHAQIFYKAGKLFVVDTGSSNGTFIDKKRIPAGKPLRLKNGSRVSFGGTCAVKIGFEKRSKEKRG